jgi:hypothetical protein
MNAKEARKLADAVNTRTLLDLALLKIAKAAKRGHVECAVNWPEYNCDTDGQERDDFDDALRALGFNVWHHADGKKRLVGW